MGCHFAVHASFWCDWVHCKTIIVIVECSHWYWSACQKPLRLDQVALLPGFTQKHCTVSQKSPERSFKVAQTRCAAPHVFPTAQMPSRKKLGLSMNMLNLQEVCTHDYTLPKLLYWEIMFRFCWCSLLWFPKQWQQWYMHCMALHQGFGDESTWR